jgi:hypothetical protein
VIRALTRFSPTALIACLALVLVTAGTAGAAAMISGKQVKDGSLTGRDVKDRSLTAADFSGSVAGASGVSGWEHRIQRQDIPANTYRSWEVRCTGTKRALGGGVSGSGRFTLEINESAPAGEATGWAATATNEGGVPYSAYVWVICADVS